MRSSLVAAHCARATTRLATSAIAFVFYLPDPAMARRVVDALEADNVPATRLYHDGELLPRDYVDLHAYEAWMPLHEKRMWSSAAGRGATTRARWTTRRTRARARWTCCAAPCTWT